MKFRSLFAALGVLSLASFSFGQADIWNATSGNWSSAGNWTLGLPANDGSVGVAFANLVPVSSTIDTNYTVAFVTIEGISSLTINSSGGSTLTTLGAIADTSASPVTINAAILGTGGIVVSDGGSMVLGVGGSLSTYSGATEVLTAATSISDSAANSFSKNSALQVDYGSIYVNFNETAASLGDYLFGQGTVNLATGATLTLNGSVATYFSGTIAGPGGLAVNGTDSLLLSSANTYTGATSIGAGSSIQIGNGGTTGSFTSSGVSGSGTLTFDRSDAVLNYAGNLTGMLNVGNTGNGVVTLSGDNTYSGATTLQYGTLLAGSNTAFSPNSTVTLLGTSTLAINTFAVTTGAVNSGSLSTHIDMGPGGGSLTIGGTTSSSFAGILSGGGGLTYTSYLDTLYLLGNNNSTYTGTMTIDQGTIQVGQGSTAGSLGTGNIVFIANAGLTFDLAETNTYSNIISGPGTVFIEAGDVTLSGNNTFNGILNVSNSTLEAGSSMAFGHLPTLNITSNGIVKLDNYSLTVGNISGDSTAAINLGSGELSLGNFVSGTTYAGTITGTGILNAQVISSLTLTGNNNTYSGGTIINSGSVAADNSTPGVSALGSGAITIYGGGTLQIGADDNNGYVNTLGISDAGYVDFQRTGLDTFTNSITGTGGVEAQDGGNVTLSGDNVYSGITEAYAATLTAGSTSAFGGTGESMLFITQNGTVNLNGFNNTVGSIQATAGSTLQLGSATLTTGGANNIEIYSGNITGTGGIDFVGNSTTYFMSAIAYTGPTSIASGATLEIGFNGSTAGSLASSSVSGTGIFAFDVSTAYTYAGDITNGISVRLMTPGTGPITLSGDNSYTGATVINAGTLKAGSATALGNTSEVDFPLSQGVLDLTSFGATIGSLVGLGGSSVNLGGNTLIINGPGGTYAGSITGTAGQLSILGGGNNTVLDGLESYTGGTFIGEGATLSIGDGNATGSTLGGNVDNAGTLIFAPNATDLDVFTHGITDIGNVVINGTGTGTITFSGTGLNNYTGTTTINSGILADGANESFSPDSSMIVNQLGTLMVNHDETVGDLEDGGTGGNVIIHTGATLATNGQNNPGPFTGTISGGGSIVVDTVEGSQGFAGNSTYTGGTDVQVGEIFIGSSTVGAPGAITSGPVGTGTLTFENDTEMSPTTNVTLANAIVLNGSSDIDNDDGPFNMTLSGVISGTNGFEWCTWSNLVLTNSNTFQGGVDMREGYLFLGSDTAAGTGQIYLDSGSSLAAYGGPGITRTIANDVYAGGDTAQLGNSDNNYLTLTGQLAGGAAITYLGGPSGTLTLSGDDSGFSGQLSIGSGTVIANSPNALGGGGSSVALTGNAGLNLEGATVTGPVTLSGSDNTVSGNGTITDPVASSGITYVYASSSPAGGAGGTLTFQGGITANPGLTIEFRLYNATGTAGTGWGVIDSGGVLNFSSATVGSINFDLASINSAGGSANAINFNPATSYTWLVASSPGGVTAFNPDLFDFSAAGFTNSLGGGTFSVSDSGNNLYLNFTPVPEPSTWAMIGIGAILVAGFSVRRMRRSQRA